MPNFKVLQDVPSELRSRVYGLDGATDIALLVDASGAVAIQDNGSSITVDATNLDIRALTNASDSVLIYGNDGTNNVVILTDASGVLQVSSSLSFVEATQTVGTATAFVGSTAEDVSTHPNYTWFIQNTDPTNTANVKLEISPNSTDWLLDGTSYVVGTSTAITLEPNVFLKWTRVSYQATTAGADATLVLIWQAYS